MIAIFGVIYAISGLNLFKIQYIHTVCGMSSVLCSVYWQLALMQNLSNTNDVNIKKYHMSIFDGKFIVSLYQQTL